MKRSAVLPKYCNSGCNSRILGRRLILPMYGTMPGSARKGVDLTVSSIEFRVHATWSRSHGTFLDLKKKGGHAKSQKMNADMQVAYWCYHFGVGSANLDQFHLYPRPPSSLGTYCPGPGVSAATLCSCFVGLHENHGEDSTRSTSYASSRAGSPHPRCD